MENLEQSRFQEDEEKVREKAQNFKNKLLETKANKKQQYSKQIKEELIAQYQSKFDEFKKEIDEYCANQKSSIDLIREFRLGEITEFEAKIQHSIQNMTNQEKMLREKQKELQFQAEEAIQFLNEQKMKQMHSEQQKCEEELAQTVKQYEDSIEVE